jgi:hypothetical protein
MRKVLGDQGIPVVMPPPRRQGRIAITGAGLVDAPRHRPHAKTNPLLTWLSRSPEKKTNTDRSRCGSFNWDHVAGHIRVIGLVYRRNPFRVLLDSGPPPPRGTVAEKAFHTELIMDAFGRLVDWCSREGESLQMQREMLQSGKFRIFKDEGSGQVDASSEIIERISANITELDSLLDECKVRPSDAQTS